MNLNFFACSILKMLSITENYPEDYRHWTGVETDVSL